jgi:hypothetical protein
MESEVAGAIPLAAVSWLVTCGSGVLAWRHGVRMRGLCSPGAAELASRARSQAGDGASGAELHAEVLALRADAERALGLAVIVPRSLSRICLSSGTAFGVLALIRAGEGGLGMVVGGVAAMVGGLFGAGLCAHFGRQASAVAREARGSWRRDARLAQGVLGGEAEGRGESEVREWTGRGGTG